MQVTVKNTKCLFDVINNCLNVDISAEVLNKQIMLCHITTHVKYYNDIVKICDNLQSGLLYTNHEDLSLREFAVSILKYPDKKSIPYSWRGEDTPSGTTVYWDRLDLKAGEDIVHFNVTRNKEKVFYIDDDGIHIKGTLFLDGQIQKTSWIKKLLRRISK